ncbi:MAG: RNA polymerase sigma factor [Steroidobacteraceae bacterium]
MEQFPAPVENAHGGPEDLALPRQSDVRGPVAFELIMRRHNQRLYRLAFSLTGDAGEAEDILQESYIRAFLRLSSFAGTSSLGAWLASIVRHSAIDHLRSRQARRAALTFESELPCGNDEPRPVLERAASESPSFNPELSSARDELRDVLEQAIHALPVQFRTVFMLREVEGLSLREVADYLAVPVATVKSRDHRARSLLREKLGGEIGFRAHSVFPFLGARCDRIVARVLARLPER